MSDLISRSALYDALIKCDGFGRKSCELVAEVIKNQPCAYNVDKVVEELEKLADHYHKCCLVDYNEGAEVGIRESISIVRKGGVDHVEPKPEPQKPEPPWKQAFLRTFLGRGGSYGS